MHACAFASSQLRYCQQELFVRISRENFTAACVMSYRFTSFRCTSSWLYFPWSRWCWQIFFFLFQYLPLSDFRKNNAFENIQRRETAWYRRVHRPFLYSTLLFSLIWRERARQTLVEFKHPSNAISIRRQLWWSFRNVAVILFRSLGLCSIGIKPRVSRCKGKLISSLA